jgi:hypothetical protein
MSSSYYFDQHSARYLRFKPGEKLSVAVEERGRHALAKVSCVEGKSELLASSRGGKLVMPDKAGALLPVDLDAAFTGSMQDFLGSNSGIAIRFKGESGTQYVHELQPQAGTQRWTYLLTALEPGSTCYVCSTPCGKWHPRRAKPRTAKCPGCTDGLIIKAVL